MERRILLSSGPPIIFGIFRNPVEELRIKPLVWPVRTFRFQETTMVMVKLTLLSGVIQPQPFGSSTVPIVPSVCSSGVSRATNLSTEIMMVTERQILRLHNVEMDY